VCELDLVAMYGDLGKNYIHVHHHKKVSQRAGRYKIDPVNDLCPVCPNCHAMIHRKARPLDVGELKAIIAEVKCKRGLSLE
jgi:5-methylcytosine-specific restriction protein A